MNPTPENLVTFIRGLTDDLLLPALWLVRRSDLGAILEFYEPDESLLEAIEDRLFAQACDLYHFVQDRRTEN